MTEAAQLFMEAEWRDASLQCPSFEEHLTAAINCYNHAVKVSPSLQCPSFEEHLTAAINCYNHAVKVSHQEIESSE